MSESDLVAVMIRWQETFDQHTKEELERYREILKEIKSNRIRYDAKHREIEVKIDALADTLNKYVVNSSLHEPPCMHLKLAIPDNDYAGHGERVKKVLNSTKELKEIKLDTKKRIISGVTISGLLIMFYAMLEYFKAWIHSLK